MKTITPKMKNEDYKTVVNIEPSFVDDYNNEGRLMPVAHVNVEYIVKGKLLLSAAFDKILSETSFEDDCLTAAKSEDMEAVRAANDLINSGLSEVGLGGLETLDIFSHVGLEIPTYEQIQNILVSELGLSYIEQIGKTFVYQNKGGFYDLEVLRYNNLL